MFAPGNHITEYWFSGSEEVHIKNLYGLTHWPLGYTWWHHGPALLRVTGLCAGNSPVTGEFPAQRPVTRSFDASFDLRLHKHLRKQSWSWWFETPSSSLWHHHNVNDILYVNFKLILAFFLEEHLLSKWHQVNVIRPHWWQGSFGSGDGFVPPGSKLLPQPNVSFMVSPGPWIKHWYVNILYLKAMKYHSYHIYFIATYTSFYVHSHICG